MQATPTTATRTIKLIAEKRARATGDIRRVALAEGDAARFDKVWDAAKALFPDATALRYVDEDGDRVTIATQSDLDTALHSPALTPSCLRLIVELAPSAAASAASPQPPQQQQQQQQQPFDFASMAPYFEQFGRFVRDAVSSGAQNMQTWFGPQAQLHPGMPMPPPPPPHPPMGPMGPAPPAGPAVHMGIVCDGCGAAPITGVRYRCCVCPDYDLCPACMAKPGIHDAAHAFAQIPFPVPQHVAKKICRCTLKGRPFFGGPHPHRHGGPHPCHGGAPFGGPHACRGGPWGRFGGHPFWAWLQQQMGGAPFSAEFLQDVTLEDGTPVEIGKPFTKIWRVRNTGAEAWPADCVLRFTGGDRLGAPDVVPLSAVAPGATADLVVEVVVVEPRRCMGFWNLSTADGRLFGPRMWIDVTGVPAADAPATATTEQIVPPPPAVEPETTTQPSAPPAEPVVPVAEPEKPAEEPQPQQPSPTESAAAFGATAEENRMLETLRGMGFTDTSLNLGLIRMNRGNMEAVLYALLGAH